MDTYHHQAALLKLVAHPIRLRILDVLRAGDECVCHLAAALDKPQPYISQQLAILRNGGVIVDEREGTNIFYHLADANVARLLAAIGDPTRSAAQGDSGPRRRTVPGCNCPKCTGPTLKQDH